MWRMVAALLCQSNIHTWLITCCSAHFKNNDKCSHFNSYYLTQSFPKSIETFSMLILDKTEKDILLKRDGTEKTDISFHLCISLMCFDMVSASRVVCSSEEFNYCVPTLNTLLISLEFNR